MSLSSHTQLPINYSISSIITFILKDNHRAYSFLRAGKRKQYKRCTEMISGAPGLKSLLQQTPETWKCAQGITVKRP